MGWMHNVRDGHKEFR